MNHRREAHQIEDESTRPGSVSEERVADMPGNGAQPGHILPGQESI